MEINLKHLCAINKYAASKEETRYYLNGVFVVADGVWLTMAATDGHRLVVHRRPLSIGVGNETFSCIVPRMFLEAFKFSKREPDLCLFEKRANIIEIKRGGTTSTVEEVDGTFPDYKRILSKTDIDPSPARFVGRYCADFDALAKEFETVATITPRGKEPALVTFSNRDDLYGVLSPIPSEKFPFAMRAPF